VDEVPLQEERPHARLSDQGRRQAEGILSHSPGGKK